MGAANSDAAEAVEFHGRAAASQPLVRALLLLLRVRSGSPSDEAAFGLEDLEPRGQLGVDSAPAAKLRSTHEPPPVTDGGRRPPSAWLAGHPFLLAALRARR